MMFREESIWRRAQQVLGITSSASDLKTAFKARIRQYHPEARRPQRKGQTEEQAKLHIEAYNVLRGTISPLECPLLENDDLLSSLLPDGVHPIKLGIKYEDWVKDQFYDFVKPRKDKTREHHKEKRGRSGL